MAGEQQSISRIPDLLVALGIGAAFYFLPYVVKDMPPYVALSGVVGAFAILLLGFLPIEHRYVLPIILMVIGVLCVVTGAGLLKARTVAAKSTTPTNAPSGNREVAGGSALDNARPAAGSTGGELTHPVPVYRPNPLTMKDLFETDFTSGSFGGEMDLQVRNTSPVIRLSFQVVTDFISRTKFLAVYVPASPEAFNVCLYVADSNQTLLNSMDDTMTMSTTIPGQTAATTSKDLIFSRLVYVYLDADFTLQQLAALETYFKSKGLSVQFRGSAWRALHWDEKRPQRIPRPPDR